MGVLIGVLNENSQYVVVNAGKNAQSIQDIVVSENQIYMFKVAGPVIVVGVALSMVVGLIYWIVGLVNG